MEILRFDSQYIFSLLLYVVKKYLFTKYLEIHNHDCTAANKFHLSITDLIKYQK